MILFISITVIGFLCNVRPIPFASRGLGHWSELDIARPSGEVYVFGKLFALVSDAFKLLLHVILHELFFHLSRCVPATGRGIAGRVGGKCEVARVVRDGRDGPPTQR